MEIVYTGYKSIGKKLLADRMVRAEIPPKKDEEDIKKKLLHFRTNHRFANALKKKERPEIPLSIKNFQNRTLKLSISAASLKPKRNAIKSLDSR